MYDWRPNCKCGEPKLHTMRYDTYYCLKCNEWRENECECGAECEFKGRPEKPSMMSEKDLKNA